MGSRVRVITTGSQGDRGTVPLELVNLHQDWGQHLIPPAGCGQDMGSKAKRTRAYGQELPSPPPLLGTLERAEQETYQGPEAPATAQSWPGQGQEPGEILEMPLSPAKTPGPLPGLPTASLTPTPAKLRARHPVPTSRQETEVVEMPSVVAKKQHLSIKN